MKTSDKLRRNILIGFILLLFCCVTTRTTAQDFVYQGNIERYMDQMKFKMIPYKYETLGWGNYKRYIQDGDTLATFEPFSCFIPTPKYYTPGFYGEYCFQYAGNQTLITKAKPIECKKEFVQEVQIPLEQYEIKNNIINKIRYARRKSCRLKLSPTVEAIFINFKPKQLEYLKEFIQTFFTQPMTDKPFQNRIRTVFYLIRDYVSIKGPKRCKMNENGQVNTYEAFRFGFTSPQSETHKLFPENLRYLKSIVFLNTADRVLIYGEDHEMVFIKTNEVGASKPKQPFVQEEFIKGFIDLIPYWSQKIIKKHVSKQYQPNRVNYYLVLRGNIEVYLFNYKRKNLLPTVKKIMETYRYKYEV